MKVLIFGATGSVGNAVLRACLASPRVTEVRALARRQIDLGDIKLKSVVHQNYLEYSSAARSFDGLDSCFYCLGIAVSKASGEDEYRRITHDFAVAAATKFDERSPGAPFHYISGGGANLESRFMWARVKAETERELIASVGATCWRPGAIDAPPSATTPKIYGLARVFFPVMKPIRRLYVTGDDLGRAMIQATLEGIRGRVIENAEIRDIADRARQEELVLVAR